MIKEMQTELERMKERQRLMGRRNVALKTKALEAIEGICMLDERDQDNPFYKIAHVALGVCENPHEDWQSELDAVHERLVKNGVI